MDEEPIHHSAIRCSVFRRPICREAMQSPLRYGSLTRRVNAVWDLSAKLGESGTRSSACFDYRSTAVSKFGDHIIAAISLGI
jgi:hypothetical protein